MAETSNYVPWPYEERTGPIENTTTPLHYLPWAHLTKDEFVQAKKKYTKYWYDNLSIHNHARVFGELTYRVNYETGACFPGRASIAKRLGISEKTVHRAIKGLEDHGLIQVRRKRALQKSEDGFLTRGVGRSNVYTIRFEKTMHYEDDFLVVGVDEDLDCLTLGGLRRLPPWHLWYHCEAYDDDTKLPLTPPRPAIDAGVPDVGPPADPTVSIECPTKGLEGYEGHEGKQGQEGTESTTDTACRSVEAIDALTLHAADESARDFTVVSEKASLQRQWLSQKPESRLSDYHPSPLTALEERRDAERQQRENMARHEKAAAWKAVLKRTVGSPIRLEVPLEQEEVLLV